MTALARGSLLWVAAGLAVVSIGLAARHLPWRFAGESGLPPPPLEGSDAAAPEDVSVEPILALSPFGRLVDRVDEGPAQETALGLTLHGVVIASGPEGSSAIVSGPSGPAQAYMVGQEIAPAATLAEVHGDHVVLLVEGRLETLSFPERRGEDVDGAAAMRALVTEPSQADDGPAASDDPEAIIAGFRERIQDNPQAVLDELGLVASDEGYIVAEGDSDSVMRAGLQLGDLVTKVNGQQVGNIEQDRSLFDDVTASGHARIEVTRDGQGIVLSFPLR